MALNQSTCIFERRVATAIACVGEQTSSIVEIYWKLKVEWFKTLFAA